LACPFVLEAPCPLTFCAVVPPRVREQEVLRRSQDLAERRREELNLRSPEVKAARRAEKARLQAERLRLALQWCCMLHRPRACSHAHTGCIPLLLPPEGAGVRNQAVSTPLPSPVCMFHVQGGACGHGTVRGGAARHCRSARRQAEALSVHQHGRGSHSKVRTRVIPSIMFLLAASTHAKRGIVFHVSCMVVLRGL
jgi:hypothetical protein